MCEPITAISIASGVASAAGGMMQAQAQHQAAQAAADRQNLINERNYQQQLAIAARKDQIKGDAFKRRLEAHAKAKETLARQEQLNQMEQIRASIANQQNLKETGTEIAFEKQSTLVKSIQAQGTVLASGQQSGQSLLLNLMDQERQLGFEEAALNAKWRDATVAFNIAERGIDLDKYSADSSAYNKLPSKPVAPHASFAPVKQPKVQGPSGLGLMGGMISAAAGGLSTGLGTYSTLDSNDNLSNALGGG